ncbi:MAG TPA: hypothetical protein VJ738_01865 [Steroidobacteraceae bacterium]|nr:hypothetical protein [Steroidobacteraceae bacterium]
MSARVLEGITPEEYLADPCASPSLSQSVAHTLVTCSPRHAWLDHPRLGGRERRSTAAMDEGSILHRLILGRGADFEVLSGFDNFRTKAAQELRDAARAAGKIPLLVPEFERLTRIATRVQSRCRDFGFEFSGRSEVPVEFTEQVEGTGAEILCRCMFDHMIEQRDDNGEVISGLILDLKKVASANPADLAARAFDAGFDIQEHAYVRAFEQLHPAAVGRVDFVFLTFEAEEPLEVVPVRLDGALQEIGRRRWSRAVALWHQLLTEGSFPWPGYVRDAITLSAPAWALARELGEDYL